MLRMLFVCCDEAIPRESQLVLALKTLCGCSTAEIALRLFTSEANVKTSGVKRTCNAPLSAPHRVLGVLSLGRLTSASVPRLTRHCMKRRVWAAALVETETTVKKTVAACPQLHIVRDSRSCVRHIGALC